IRQAHARGIAVITVLTPLPSLRIRLRARFNPRRGAMRSIAQPALSDRARRTETANAGKSRARLTRLLRSRRPARTVHAIADSRRNRLGETHGSLLNSTKG